jgi:hypothetical protein
MPQKLHQHSLQLSSSLNSNIVVQIDQTLVWQAFAEKKADETQVGADEINPDQASLRAMTAALAWGRR